MTAPHLPLAEALRLERNVAVLAGAGAGKTYSLVTMCLHLLGGAREGHEALPCARLGLLTFTDKAAAEMRGRLRERLEALASGAQEEPELAASFARLSRALPLAAFWRKTRDELGAASIGTFHALCTQLLRRAPARSGLNPAFELLDERTARALLEGVAQRLVLERVQANDAHVSALVRELGFGGGGARGLVELLRDAYARIREEGVAPETVPVTDEAAARAQLDAELARAREVVATAHAQRLTVEQRAGLDDLLAAFEGATAETLAPRIGRLLELSKGFGRVKALKPLRLVLADVGEAEGGALLRALGAWQVAPYEARLRGLLGALAAAHDAELDRRGALDFTGLLARARTLLRDFPEARAEAQARFGALLVDEFQDTNRLQLELLLLLAERRDGAPRVLAPGVDLAEALPVEPAFLAVVGDRKQAIYEFRGADVGVFGRVAQVLERQGGARAWLQASRRPSPRLLRALNAAMAKVLGPAQYPAQRLDFEVPWVAEEDELHAVREVEVAALPVVQLSAALGDAPLEELREADADAVARWLAATLASGEPAVVEHRAAAKGPRPARGGDVALLFKRFSQLEVYRQALVRHGVRHRVVRGRGFFGAQEVVDLGSFLKVLADADDALSLAAVLRSPLVALSDAALVRLSLWGTTPGLKPRGVLFAPELDLSGLDDGERARLVRFRRVYDRLRRERDRLGLRAVLRVALDELGFRVAVAGAPFGEQALANVDKLIEVAAARDAQGVAVAAFAGELLELAAREPTEAQGEVLDEQDADAVTLCTVHQAKGLEWPVVVLPELFAVPANDTEGLRFDRVVGLALKPFLTPEVSESARFAALRAVRQRRARAESLRLLYVAATRARDRLVLGLAAPPKKARAGMWCRDLEPATWQGAAGEVEVVDVGTLPVRAASVVGAARVDDADATAAVEVRAAVARVRDAPEAVARAALLPVTQLQDFCLCPRRFRYAHLLGLDERPRAFEWREDGDDARPPAGDARSRGAAAHRLLELTPLDVVGTPRLAEALERVRRIEGLSDDAEVLAWVSGFWSTEWGRGLNALGDGAVRRELPFVLRLAAPDGFQLHLRGQVDLLVARGGVAEVVDYKASKAPAAGLAPYAFQLGCYALAARRFLGGDVPVRAGIAFLREADASPRFLDELPGGGALEASLVEAARALTVAQVRNDWDARPEERCRALGCGYLYRCH